MPKSKTIDKFWNFTAATDNQSAELILYGDISSYSWWDDEITPGQFDKDLRALGDVSEIVVRINSGGGDVFAANAIYTRLKDHKAAITVKIDGWAASAATIIAMAGDTVQIPANGVFMIHDPSMGICGYYGEDDFKKYADELAVVKNSIINAYALKTNKDKDEISALMSEETWYTGDEAVNAGFCDEMLFEEADVTNCVTDYMLNSQGVMTALNFMGSFVLWGNTTACYPVNTDVKDYFIPINRMFGFVAQTAILSYWNRIDGKMNHRLIESITDSINIWLNGIVAGGHLLGARVEFRADENPETSLIAGKVKFRIFITPPSPLVEMEWVLEYDASYINGVFG